MHRLPWEVQEYEIKDALRMRKMQMKNLGDDAAEGADDGTDVGDREKPLKVLSPLRRRPEPTCVANKFKDPAVHLLESGSSRLWFYRDDDGGEVSRDDGSAIMADADDEDDDEDEGMVDMSKCSQLVGNASEQLYGCGICALWLIEASRRHPDEDLSDLLDRMELLLDGDDGGGGGLNALVASLKRNRSAPSDEKITLADLPEEATRRYCH